MMSQIGPTPDFSIPRVKRATGQIENLNDAITKTSKLVCLRVIARSDGAAPSTPDEGDAYLLTDASTGFGTGGQDDIAFWSNGWQIISPTDGLRVRVLDEQIDLLWLETPGVWEEDAHEGSVLADQEATSQLLVSVVNHFATVAASAGVYLPSPLPGKKRVVVNDGANDLDVFPDAGDEIDALGTDVARVVPSGKRCTFIALDGARWSSFLFA